MIYLPTFTLLVFSCLGGGGRGGGVLAAPSEAAGVRTPLELTFPAIESDPYIHTDYIDSNKTPVQGSGSKTESCSIPPLIDHKRLQLVNLPLYSGFCVTSSTCGDSFQGVSFVEKSKCGTSLSSSSSNLQCCIPPSKPIYCASPHVNSKCLNSNVNRKAECVGGTFVKGLCPGGTSDDVQCCVIPQNDDSPTNGNKDLKNYDHTTTAAAVVGGDGSGPPMDFEYDETAETESVPRYEDQGIEVEKFRFPAQDLGLVDSRVGGSWRVQG